MKLIEAADYESNLLIPYNDKSTSLLLESKFNITRNRVSKVFKKLFDLGVYARIKVANGDNSDYWSLNPYISFKGKLISNTLVDCFHNTIIGRACGYGTD